MLATASLRAAAGRAAPGAARSRRDRGAARDRDSRQQAPCWKSRSTRQVVGLLRRLALEQQHRGLDRERGQRRRRRPRAGRCRSAPRWSPPLCAPCAARAQARTSSSGCTGFTRKSATRICSSCRATSTSNAGIATITGGVPPSRCVSAFERREVRLARRVEVDDHDGRAVGVELAHRLGERADRDGELDLARPTPNVERTRRSKSASRHCATTRVFDRLRWICARRTFNGSSCSLRAPAAARTGCVSAADEVLVPRERRDLVGAVALGRRRHALAVEGDVAVAARTAATDRPCG